MAARFKTRPKFLNLRRVLSDFNMIIIAFEIKLTIVVAKARGNSQEIFLYRCRNQWTNKANSVADFQHTTQNVYDAA